MKIVFFNRFFHPDTSATSQILSDLAFHLAASGHDVHVVTSRGPNAEGDAETVRGVQVHRVATASTAPHNLFERAIAYFRYYRGARHAACRLVRPGDIVILKTDPPLLSAAVGPLAKQSGARVVVWLQDVFPETAHAYGVPGTGRITGAWFRHARDRSLAQADCVVAICDRMAQRIAELRCVDRDRLTVIHNWTDEREIVPLEPRDNAKRKEWRLEGKFVVAYSGNLGRVHEFDTLLDAAKALLPDDDIRFLVIGRGPRLADVMSRAAREDIRNVRFEPHQERSALSQTIGAADVHISILRPEYEGLVHPSKLYGIMAAGRPTIFIGDSSGETAAILAGTNAGVTVATGDVDGLVAAIRKLRDDGDLRQRMGRNARRALEERFSMRHGLSGWSSLLANLP